MQSVHDRLNQKYENEWPYGDARLDLEGLLERILTDFVDPDLFVAVFETTGVELWMTEKEDK